MNFSKFFLCVVFLTCLFVITPHNANAKVTRETEAKISFEKSDNGRKVLIDGKFFTEYLIKSGNKPILWPLIGPDGQRMTREYPLVKEKQPNERQDHIHHCGMWFTHGDVNGISFWHEGKNTGTIKHIRFDDKAPHNAILTHNDWLDSKGKLVCQDVRTIKFGGNKKSRWIDFNITLMASQGLVTFGDTKEGSFGIRVAGTIKVDAKKGGKIANNHGDKDKAAWGKQATWVDFNGPINGKRVGIAILNHPSSHGYPTYWHARTYGLFAANPFGIKKFTSGKKPTGAITLKKGEKLTFRYRVVLHNGDEKEGKIAEAFTEYQKQK